MDPKVGPSGQTFGSCLVHFPTSFYLICCDVDSVPHTGENRALPSPLPQTGAFPTVSPSKSWSTKVFLSDMALMLYKINGYAHSQQSHKQKEPIIFGFESYQNLDKERG